MKKNISYFIFQKYGQVATCLYLISLIGLPLFAQEGSEYEKYLKMGDYQMSEGNYEKAKKLYGACQAMPNRGQDPLIGQKLSTCTQFIETQQQLNAVIIQKKDIKPDLDRFLALEGLNPNDKYFKERLLQKLEEAGDKLFALGELELSAQYFLLVHGIRPLPNMVMRLERVNEKYQEKTKQPLPLFVQFKKDEAEKKQRAVKQESPEAEYQRFWAAATDAFKVGNYPLALKRYNLCLSVRGYENDKAAQDQIMAATKAREALKRGNALMQQNKCGEAAHEYRTLLVINPDDNLTKQMASSALECYGDFYREKQLWADARKNYEEAFAFAGSAQLLEKLKAMDRKIAAATRSASQPTTANEESPKKPKKTKSEKAKTIDSAAVNVPKKTIQQPDKPLTARQLARLEKQRQKEEYRNRQRQLRQTEREKRRAERLARRKPNKDEKPKGHFEIDPEKGKGINWAEVVAMELSGGLNYGLPMLKNQTGNIQSRGTLGPRFGAELVFLPNKTVSLVVGANYGISKFNSVRASSNTPLERFEIGHLQIPILLRLNKDIDDNTQLHLQGGVVLNKVTKFNYDNYTKNINQTNTAIFNGNTLGFEVSVGYTTTFLNKSRIGMMLTYNRSLNLLDPNYKDEATNRSSTSMLLSGVGFKVIFRVF